MEVSDETYLALTKICQRKLTDTFLQFVEQQAAVTGLRAPQVGYLCSQQMIGMGVAEACAASRLPPEAADQLCEQMETALARALNAHGCRDPLTEQIPRQPLPNQADLDRLHGGQMQVADAMLERSRRMIESQVRWSDQKACLRQTEMLWVMTKLTGFINELHDLYHNKTRDVTCVEINDAIARGMMSLGTTMLLAAHDYAPDEAAEFLNKAADLVNHNCHK